MELVEASLTKDSGTESIVTRGDGRREAMQKPIHRYKAGPAQMAKCEAFYPGSFRGDNVLLVSPCAPIPNPCVLSGAMRSEALHNSAQEVSPIYIQSGGFSTRCNSWA